MRVGSVNTEKKKIGKQSGRLAKFQRGDNVDSPAGHEHIADPPNAPLTKHIAGTLTHATVVS